MKRILLAMMAALWATAAYAQAPVVTLNNQLPTLTFSNVTITPANTFFTVLNAAAKRRGCTIQYNSASSTGTGFIFIGGASATTPTSFQVTPKQTFNCTLVGGGAVITDGIQATGSVAGDIFTFSQQ